MNISAESLETVGITDAGGRGAAIADWVGRSKHVRRIIGTPGSALMGINVPPHISFASVPSTLSAETGRQIAAALTRENTTYFEICQDDAVAADVRGVLESWNYRNIIGPSKAAGEIESSKIWGRNFMRKYDIPHPKFHAFSDPSDAVRFLVNWPEEKGWAVKADGSAAGKGVIIAKNRAEAHDAIYAMRSFGDAGKKFLLEDLIVDKDGQVGEEFSAYAVCDGEHWQTLGYAQDHKRVFDGDQGPNTGGMGCVSNPLIMTPDIIAQTNVIFEKTFKGLREEERPYKGVLYLGGMVVDGKVIVVEDNARWGDPEAQVIIPSIQNDYIEFVNAVVEQRIDRLRVETDDLVRVVVALTSKGYPGDTKAAAGKEIYGMQQLLKVPNLRFYGGGMKYADGKYLMNGGRVGYFVGEGKNVEEARNVVYGALEEYLRVEDDMGHYRKDIGYRDVARLRAS